MVTEGLFKKYPNARAMSALTAEELEPMIKTCGLYHSKARHIVDACRQMVDEYDGEVPRTREALMKLPGVGQKTAGVVLLAAFGGDEIPVDTHIFRVANRIGLACADTPEKVETQLRAVIPRNQW